MSERIHALAQLLPGKSSLDECSVDELQHLTKRYPYFAPAQFLLLQKLKATGSPDAQAQLHKAVLYYHDPLQFDYFVSSDKFYVDEALQTQDGQKEKAVLSPATNEWHPSENNIADEQAFLQQDADDTDGPERIESDYLPREKAEEEEATKPVTVLPPSETRETDVHRQEHETIEELPAQPEETDQVTVNGEPEQPVNELEEQAPVTVTLPAEVNTAASDDAAAPLLQEVSQKEATQQPAPQPGVQIASTKKNESEGLAFEPFHTVDYFASQGIKISADELPKDRLGKQMRSFTEWLKMMKRLPATEMAKTPESTAEKTVESLASHSVEESDVVTEAMAEVWAKQGNRAKAMETYNKLSLLNPSKKAYFAAKIENLKGS